MFLAGGRERNHVEIPQSPLLPLVGPALMHKGELHPERKKHPTPGHSSHPFSPKEGVKNWETLAKIAV